MSEQGFFVPQGCRPDTAPEGVNRECADGVDAAFRMVRLGHLFRLPNHGRAFFRESVMYRFEPPINDKRSMTKDDWPGWYQLSVVREGKLVAVCRWWSGKRWGFDPHHKRGFLMSEMGDVRGIVRLVEE